MENQFASELAFERQRLERIWQQRLAAEYENIVYLYRLRLQRPVLRIEAITHLWGRWDPETRTLTIARGLIENHSWDVVIQILKHEIAHQLVSDEDGVDEGHGAYFQRACERLGLSGWAASSQADIPGEVPHWKNSRLPEAEERLLNRVEKLLALASSSNEHEAWLAMKKVRELYAKHNLDRLREKRGAAMAHLTIHHRKKRIERYQSVLGGILNDYYFVEVIYTPVFEAASGEEFKGMELLGTRENVAMAEYVYHFLRQRIELLWKAHQHPRPRPTRERSSFFMGVLAGFRDKLAAEAKADEATQDSPGFALVRLRDRQLEDFVKARYPRLVNRRHGRGRYHRDAFDAGHAEGQRLVIHRGITTRDGNRGRLLPPAKD